MIRGVKRETRTNIQFLILFLAISLPGAVMLFRKKLDPTSPRLDQPDPVVQALPYMVPPPAPPAVRWMVPPRTLAWLTEIVRSRTGENRPLSSVVDGPDWEPVISADHQLQVAAVGPTGSGTRFGLIVWNVRAVPAAGRLGVGVVNPASGADAAATVNDAEPVAIPPEVRKELVGLGFTRPPAEVTWIEADCNRAFPRGSDVGLTVDSRDPAVALHATARFVVR